MYYNEGPRAYKQIYLLDRPNPNRSDKIKKAMLCRHNFSKFNQLGEASYFCPGCKQEVTSFLLLTGKIRPAKISTKKFAFTCLYDKTDKSDLPEIPRAYLELSPLGRKYLLPPEHISQ